MPRRLNPSAFCCFLLWCWKAVWFGFGLVDFYLFTEFVAWVPWQIQPRNTFFKDSSSPQPDFWLWGIRVEVHEWASGSTQVHGGEILLSKQHLSFCSCCLCTGNANGLGVGHIQNFLFIFPNAASREIWEHYVLNGCPHLRGTQKPDITILWYLGARWGKGCCWFYGWIYFLKERYISYQEKSVTRGKGTDLESRHWITYKVLRSWEAKLFKLYSTTW